MLILLALAPAVLAGGGDLLFAERRFHKPDEYVDLALADWNEDGFDDLIAASPGGRAHLFLSNGTGGLVDTELIFVGVDLGSIVAEDFNLDGHIDLAATVPQDEVVEVYAGVGDGTFVGPVGYDAGFLPADMDAADVDNDGLLDLLVCNTDLHDVSVLLGRQTGFLPPYVVNVGARPDDIETADLDGDGDQDIVLLTENTDELVVCLGDGRGSFSDPVSFPWAGHNLRVVELGDLTGDGFIDAVVGDNTAVWLYPGMGDGTLGSPMDVALPPGETDYFIASDLKLADFDLDGQLDLIVTDRRGGRRITTFQGGGLPPLTVLSALRISDETANRGILALGELSGDNRIDIVLGGAESGNLSVVRSTSQALLGTPLAGSTSSRIFAVNVDGQGLDELVDLPAAPTSVGLVSPEVLRVLATDGSGGYVEVSSLQIPDFPEQVAWGDFDGDQNLDLLTSMNPGSLWELFFHKGDGSGSFAAAVPAGLSGFVGDLEVADMDADGNLDALTLSLSSQVTLLYGNGDGTLGPATIQPTSAFEELAPADFDGDGWIDVLAVRDEPDRLALFTGTGVAGNSALNPAVWYALPEQPGALEVADIDRDGDLDAVIGAYTEQLMVATNLGSGVFSAVELYDAGVYPYRLAVGDFTGDGLADIAVGDAVSDGLIATLAGVEEGFSEPLLTFQSGSGEPIADSFVITDADGDEFGDLVQSGTYVHENLAPAPAALTASPESISLASGGTQTLQLCAGPAFAGHFYAVLGTTTGTEPGLPIGGLQVPLNLSSYLLSTLTSGAFLQGGSGFLSAGGAATVTNVVPPGLSAGLVGATIHHAFLVVDLGPPAIAVFVSAPVGLEIEL